MPFREIVREVKAAGGNKGELKEVLLKHSVDIRGKLESLRGAPAGVNVSAEQIGAFLRSNILEEVPAPDRYAVEAAFKSALEEMSVPDNETNTHTANLLRDVANALNG